MALWLGDSFDGHMATRPGQRPVSGRRLGRTTGIRTGDSRVTSIPLDAIPATDTTRRDQWGRYLVVPPGGGKPTGYTRVTTVAKALDDTGGLAPWKATMAAGGIIMRH